MTIGRQAALIFLWLYLAVLTSALGAVVQGPIVNPANGHLYYLLSQNNWTGSETEAVVLGGHLATIDDFAEQQWVFNTFGRGFGGGRLLWIGLNDSAAEGSYRWSSGEAGAYRFWTPGEPNNASAGEDYTAMYYAGHSAEGRWNDWPNINADPIGIPFMGVAEVLPENASTPLRNPVLIDFESLRGMSSSPQAAPECALLSDQLTLTHGVSFRSTGAAVAVVNLGTGHATSGTNGIGGVASGSLNYSAPIEITLSFPGYRDVPATTDYLSVRVDLLRAGPSVGLTAYGLDGTVLASTNVGDTGGRVVALAVPGIHRVSIRGNGGTAFDDLYFNELIPTKEIIDFEGNAGMDFVAGATIPSAYQLTDRYLSSGVLFNSSGGYAALLNLGTGHASSGTNGFGGSTMEGLLAYDESAAVEIKFVSPKDRNIPASTDYFSVRVDQGHTDGSGFYTLQALDLYGEVIASRVFEDAEGELGALTGAGMHRVRIIGSGSTAFDDVVFNRLQIEPPQLRISEEAGAVRVLWPSAFFGYILESAFDLNVPVSWAPVEQLVEAQGSTLSVRMSPLGGQQYFRIRKASVE